MEPVSTKQAMPEEGRKAKEELEMKKKTLPKSFKHCRLGTKTCLGETTHADQHLTPVANAPTPEQRPPSTHLALETVPDPTATCTPTSKHYVSLTEQLELLLINHNNQMCM